MIIYVAINFQQDPDDLVIGNNSVLCKVRVADDAIYQDYLIKDEALIEAFEIEHKALMLKESEQYIYSYYPQKKQQQDQVAFALFNTQLMLLGIDNLMTLLDQCASKIFRQDLDYDSAVAELLTTIVVESEDEEKVKKWLRVAVRSKWVQRVIAETNEAYLDSRNVNYPSYII